MAQYQVYVYAICKNEEQFAARFMESMREADGVYILDTGSTDNSVEKLRALGAHVTQEIIQPFRFDTARNRSLALVPEDADICVCVDLDECFVPGWRANVEKAWQKGADQLRYKYVWSFTPDGQEDVVFYADKMHARHGFGWTRPVHEVLCCDQTPRRVLAEGVQLNHDPDPQKSRAQYLPLLELSVQEYPDDDRSLHYLGREYFFHGQWDKCIRTLKQHLLLSAATWRDERCASCRYIARAYGEKGNAYDQERYLLFACAEAPHLREPWMELAQFAYARMDWPQLLYACERALKITDRPLTYMTEGACYGVLPYDLLSVACFHLGLKKRAQEAISHALALSPNDERLQNNCKWIEQM